MKTRVLLFSILMACMSLATNAQTWFEVGQGGFSEGETSQQQIAMDGNTPYVAYSDHFNSQKITVKKYNDTNWETVGQTGFGGVLTDLDFVIENGQFYIAYSAGGAISVMTLSGGSWIYSGATPLANGGVVSLTISAGIPYIAYQDSDFGNKISVKKMGSSGWGYVGSPGITTCTLPNVVDIEVSGNTVYVAYRDTDNGYKASVMKFEGTSWSIVGSEGFSGATHDTYNALAIHNGQPYVASWNSAAMGAVYTFDGTSWTQVGGSISDGTGRYMYLKESAAGNLYVAYADEGFSKKAFVKKLNGTTWETIGTDASQSEVGYVSLAIDNSETPYLAYQDSWYIRKITVMTYGVYIDGIAETSGKSGIRIYPNPANDFIRIENINQNPITRLSIYNQLGQVVYTLTSSINSGTEVNIDITNLPTGMYFIKLESDLETNIMKLIKR